MAINILASARTRPTSHFDAEDTYLQFPNTMASIATYDCTTEIHRLPARYGRGCCGHASTFRNRGVQPVLCLAERCHTITCQYFGVIAGAIADCMKVAASESQVDVVRFLIGLGAKVNAMDDYGE